MVRRTDPLPARPVKSESTATDPLTALEQTLTEERRKVAALQEQLQNALDECRKLEQSFNQNRELYLLAIEATNLGIYDTNIRDEELDLKENWLARLGYDPKLAREQSLTWESLIHPEDYERVTSTFQTLTDGNCKSLNLEYRLRAANGDYRWIIESSKVIEEANLISGRRVVGTHFDITERKLAEEAERKQRTFAEALSASAAIFNSTLNLNMLLNLILINIAKVVQHDDADIWLIDSNKKSVHPAYRKSGVDGVLPIYSVEFLIDEIPILREVTANRKPVYLPEIQPNKVPIPTRNPKHRSCICTPILFGTNLLGFLVIYSLKKNNYSPTQIDHLHAFANQAATAIRNAQLYSQAQEVAALEERQRLAREMHDVISQTLFSATIKAEALPVMLDQEKPELIKQNLMELHKLTRGALAEMRTMLMELRPNAIINTDLCNLLQQMVDGLAGRTTAEIKYASEGYGLLPADVQTMFFRIAQESINNLLKHSKAKHVEIHFSNHKSSVILRIRDDGIGFDTNKVSSERMGVKIMRERAETAGADLRIESQPNHGTLVELDWINPQNGVQHG